MSGVLRFSWLEADGAITNWWSSDVSRNQRRFVHTEWGKFAIAVDLGRGEAQIAFNHPPEHRVIKFTELPSDSNVQLAFEAVVATGEHAAFAAELLLRAIDRDDLADRITKDGRPTMKETSTP